MTYKESFQNLVASFSKNSLLECEFYDFTKKIFTKNAQSRICHFSLKNEPEYNRNAIIMLFTIGENVGRIVIQSEGAKTVNPSSTYPQKIEALHLAKEHNWKYIALAISSNDIKNETIRDYVVSIESTSYAKATVCVLDDCISYLEEHNKPDFYRCRQEANKIEYTLTFIKKEKLLEYICLYDNRFEVNVVDDPKEDFDVFGEFSSWLTTFDNPDYTGKEKYEGYAQALERLVQFMQDKGYIKDSNLNDKNIEKYNYIKRIYEENDDVQEFDEKKNSAKAGIAALKKYIKYIEYLLYKDKQIETKTFDYSATKGSAINKIFFGTPGCGKSYYIEHNILGKDDNTKEYIGDYNKGNIIRTTFYQDYSNTDFVGQILPKISKDENGKEIVEYIFNPGPFTLALIQAIKNPDEKIALVIEEINRGNAPAIFGDIFQLLDRDNDGISEYGIVNVSIIDYLNSLVFNVNDEKIKYLFSEIKIPGNMYIFATMNTSDQNVYTLDTAFIRRWEKVKIKNSFENCSFASTKVPGMENYSWKEFVESINACIASHLDDLQVNEDKQLGVYFVKEKLLTNGNAEKFAYKVFDYLWSDVSKLDHSIFFNDYDTFEALVLDYLKKGVGVFKPNIFKEKELVKYSESEEDKNE